MHTPFPELPEAQRAGGLAHGRVGGALVGDGVPGEGEDEGGDDQRQVPRPEDLQPRHAVRKQVLHVEFQHVTAGKVGERRLGSAS